MSTKLEPAPRFIEAQAWWIASELARRNSQLLVVEAWPNDGFYHGLEVRHLRSGRHVFCNFWGSLHLFGASPTEDRLTWAETFQTQDPHEFVKVIEDRMGWQQSMADSTTRRSLSYRLFAAILALMINDRHRWTIAHGQGFSEAGRSFLKDFDGLGDAVRKIPRELDGSHWPLEHTWVVRRGGEAAAVVTDEATLFTRGSEPVDLMNTYAHRRSIEDVLWELLNAVRR